MKLPARKHFGRLRLGALVVVAVVAAVTAAPNAATADEGAILRAGGPSAVADSYVVVLKDTAVSRDALPGTAGRLAKRHGGTVTQTYRNALRGFEVRLPEAAAKRLAAEPAVRYVQQNHMVSLADTQTPTPSWGLDRIDQRTLPLNNSYNYPSTGSGVKAYIIDTGINFTHNDFGGRAIGGFDAIEGRSTLDCHGHGSHVAATVGGTGFGVAKSVTLVAVRVFDCVGNSTFGAVIAGVDWVTGDHQPGQRAVANMSLGGGYDQATNDAVAASIADGVVYAIAAGNSYGTDACNLSPASTPEAITVGATQRDDAPADYSSLGPCLDIFAPGTDITSAWYDSDTATETISGTSMATPHVAGVAALILSANPAFTAQQVRDKVVNDATAGVLVPSPAIGSPNRLLHVPLTQDFTIAVSPSTGTLTVGGSLAVTVSTTTALGNPHPVALSATGLPSGATASFSPASVASGGSSTLTISAADGTPQGTYPVTITGSGPQSTRAATLTLTVQGPAGCAQTNNADLSIRDLSTVESLTIVSGCAGNAAAGSTAEVHIVHPWQGDLTVSLVAPDGSAYPLHSNTGGSTDNLDQTFAVNLSGEAANGIWRLRIRDVTAPDAGLLNSWTLNLRTGTPSPIPTPSPASCTGTNGTDTAIPDKPANTTHVESRITISGCSGNAVAGSTVEVHIVHTWRGDLTVTLFAPDGSSYVLHGREGGSADNIDQRYTVNLSGERRNGTWRLRVLDSLWGDTGYLDNWTLIL